jgi:hypothetical protein
MWFLAGSAIRGCFTEQYRVLLITLYVICCLAVVAVFCAAGVNVARMLIDKGDLVLIADSQGIRDIYSADGNSIDNSTPLVVLVNKGTASASEVSRVSGLGVVDVLWAGPCLQH